MSVSSIDDERDRAPGAQPAVSTQIVERVPLDLLHEHPSNARKHDLAVITRSLAGLGQYRPIVVNRGTKTGRPNEILAGHGTAKAAAALGWSTIDVGFVDVDEQTATNILLVDNRASDLAEYDDRLLVELLASLDDLSLTGYDPDDYDQLVRGLGEIDEHDLDEGDADTDQGERIFGIAIECATEQQQAKLLERFTAEGLSVRALM
jgi:ParB-like chromosome segregation protein Spo0J